MKNNFLETFLGFLVLSVAILFLIFAYQNSSLRQIKNTYHLVAKFDNVEGITEGSDIMIAGVKIGYVKSVQIDPKDYTAKVGLQINKDINLPKDSNISIASGGFLGNKFININIGEESDNFKTGDIINHTRSSISLENLIGKFLYSIGTSSKN